MPSLRAGRKNPQLSANILPRLPLMSCIFAPNLAFLCHILHFCATFCIFAPHPAFLRHICYHAVTDWLSHNQSKLPISSHSANDVANLKQQWLHLSQLSNKSFAPLTLETLIINQLYQATQIWPISSYHFDSTYHQFWKLHVIALFVSAECVTFITYDSTNLNLLEFELDAIFHLYQETL